ncbi:hypothetical protein [Amycolatopsis sp. cmx-4-61]|uniref:hypothetical protein n=1 Tax=Amycolatopsis sp. cmx-4-61 TaxID=2790937 RepID=UPI003978D6E0
MTGRAAPQSGDDTAEVVFVVIAPTGELREETTDGRPDGDDPDLEVPYQSSLWTAVHALIAPDSVRVGGIPVAEQDLRAKVIDSDVARENPALFPPNPYASAVLTLLGARLEKTLLGTVAIVREEDPETGLTGSLDTKQLEAIWNAHRTVVAGAGDAARWRFC